MNPPSSNPSTKRNRDSQRPEDSPLRTKIYDIIFEHDTPSGWWFDIVLMIAILTSVALVALETVPTDNNRFGKFFWYAEWFLTILFTIEFGLRLYCVRNPWRYVFSFWGVVDLLSILPTYLTFFTRGSVGSFVMIRSIRLLRVFRVLKLWRMMDEADELAAALWKAREKIIVFLSVVLVAVTISGSLMYYVETILLSQPLEPGAEVVENQFTSIPQAMYWATVTMTTVGYGDVVPHTAAGKVISTILILLGYSLIIVPSGFVTAEITMQRMDTSHSLACEHCGARDQKPIAVFCYRCGERQHPA